MTFYTTRIAKLIVEPIEHKCPNCGILHVMDMHVFQKYKTFLGLPFFPTNKTGVAFCTHCTQSFHRKDMPEALLRIFHKVKNHTHMPLWTWTGTAALLILGIVVVNLLIR